MHKIHAPALRRTSRFCSWLTMEGDVLASPDPHAELQTLQSIELSHPLCIYPQPSRRSSTQIVETQTAGAYGPDRESVSARPIDPWRNCVDTTRFDRIGPTDRPAPTHRERPVKPLGQCSAAGEP